MLAHSPEIWSSPGYLLWFAAFLFPSEYQNALPILLSKIFLLWEISSYPKVDGLYGDTSPLQSAHCPTLVMVNSKPTLYNQYSHPFPQPVLF